MTEQAAVSHGFAMYGFAMLSLQANTGPLLLLNVSLDEALQIRAHAATLFFQWKENTSLSDNTEKLKIKICQLPPVREGLRLSWETLKARLTATKMSREVTIRRHVHSVYVANKCFLPFHTGLPFKGKRKEDTFT
jgi:hypothetical protein